MTPGLSAGCSRDPGNLPARAGGRWGPRRGPFSSLFLEVSGWRQPCPFHPREPCKGRELGEVALGLLLRIHCLLLHAQHTQLLSHMCTLTCAHMYALTHTLSHSRLQGAAHSLPAPCVVSWLLLQTLPFSEGGTRTKHPLILTQRSPPHSPPGCRSRHKSADSRVMTSLELQNQGRAEGLFTLITLHLGCCLFGQDRVISPMGMVQEGPSALASRAQSCSLGASSFSRPEILGLAWYLDGASGWGGVSSGIWVRGADELQTGFQHEVCPEPGSLAGTRPQGRCSVTSPLWPWVLCGSPLLPVTASTSALLSSPLRFYYWG